MFLDHFLYILSFISSFSFCQNCSFPLLNIYDFFYFKTPWNMLICCTSKVILAKWDLTRGQTDSCWSVFDPTSPCYVFQVAARTETGVRRRTQAMSRSCSKRKSRFSSLWGLDTTSKKKTKAHPTVSQVCEVFHLLPKFPRLIRADKLHLPISQASILPDW